MNLECDTSLATWSRTSNDNEPINCITWYEAYAFCIWDGGFLPSDAELNYVESGGAEERVYPWSVPPTATTIDCSYATYLGCLSSAGGTNVVGSKSPKGDGKWGHADLGGNVWEWVLDMGSNGDCSDCADIGALPPPGSPFGVTRVMRGGGLGGSSTLEAASENSSAPEMRSAQQGARCGRAP
jgi:formylglycine-generating enzyme required for sulfatase activity